MKDTLIFVLIGLVVLGIGIGLLFLKAYVYARMLRSVFF